jgi:hypothetical protein
MNDKITRRTVLLRSLQVPVGGALLWGLSGCSGKSGSGSGAAATTACADPATMSDAEMGTRRSLNYVEKSENPQQVCSGCSFFHAGSNCGTCDMMSGGAVNPQGHCTSWNAKPA